MDYLGTSNLRILANIIEAFIIAINDNKIVHQKDLFDSYFFSLVVTKHFFDLGKEDLLDELSQGVNLGMIEDRETQRLIKTLYENGKRVCQWTGMNFNLHYLYNHEMGSEDYYYRYTMSLGRAHFPSDYFDAEVRLISGDYNISECRYDILHICYIINRQDETGICNVWPDLLKEYIKGIKLDSVNEIRNVLDIFECHLINTEYGPTNDIIFKEIGIASHYKESMGYTKFSNDYNSYVKEHRENVMSLINMKKSINQGRA
jgi:hypothetical protein